MTSEKEKMERAAHAEVVREIKERYQQYCEEQGGCDSEHSPHAFAYVLVGNRGTYLDLNAHQIVQIVSRG